LLPGLTPDLEGIKQAAEVFRQATPGRHEIPLQVAEGDLVVSVIVGRGVHAGELLGIPATGNEVETEGIAVTESPTGGSSSTGRSATSHACFSKWARSPHRPAFKGFKSLT
jgi:SnoaL-like polyketide cyclase